MSDFPSMKLYIAPVGEKEVQIAEKNRFHRMTPQYILILSEHKEEGSAEIKANRYHLLSDEDLEWVRSCYAEIAQDFCARHEEEIKKSIGVFAREYERELKNAIGGAKGGSAK